MLRLLAALLGPIFAKELVEMARRRRYYFNRVLYGAALLFAVFLVWESYRDRLQWQDGRIIQVMADMGESLFLAISGLQYGAVYLFVPVFVCGVIAGEREAHTLELLFTTHLTDREIVLGKLASRLAVLVLLIFCALPVMSLIMLLGGIDPEGLWRIEASTLLAMLYTGAHGIYFSSTSRSPMAALVRTYWLMGLWLLALPLTMTMLWGVIAQWGAVSSRWDYLQYLFYGLVFVNPIGPFELGMERHSYDYLSSRLGEWFYPCTFVLPLAWSLFLIWRAVRRLRFAPKVTRRRARRRVATNTDSAAPPVATAEQSLCKTKAESESIRQRAEGSRCWPVPAKPLWLRQLFTLVSDPAGGIGHIAWGACALAVLLSLFLFALAVEAAGLGAIYLLVRTWIAVVVLLLCSIALIRRLQRRQIAAEVSARQQAKCPVATNTESLPEATAEDKCSVAGVAPESSPQQAARTFGWLAMHNPLWLRSRLARVYDREGQIGRIQWGAWALAIFFFLLTLALSGPGRNGVRDDGTAMVFLAPTWIGVALLTAIVSAASLVGDRRRGFLELVLVTPLEPREIVDGTVLAIWHHLQRIIWLPAVLGFVFCRFGGPPLLGTAASFFTGVLCVFVLVSIGVLCSLTAKTVPSALVPTFVFGFLMCLGLIFLSLIFKEQTGPVLWVACPVFAVASWLWARKIASPAAVACHFIAVHLALVSVVTCWTYDGQSNDFPILAMNPGFWIMAMLDDNPRGWFDSFKAGSIDYSAWLGLTGYWVALVANLLWARWWMIRHFDRLVGRTQACTSRPGVGESRHLESQRSIHS